jgi:AcrR family transcriptional regulator
VSDPRVARTQLHVLSTARRLLVEHSGEPLTFTLLAKEAQVSRRTLYTHWGTIEKVISAAVTLRADDDIPDYSDLTPRESLEKYLFSFRDAIAEPVTAVALTALVGQAAHDKDAASSVLELAESRMERFRERVGPITDEQFALLFGPIFYTQLVTREKASDELIESLVVAGAEILDLDSQYASVSASGGR